MFHDLHADKDDDDDVHFRTSTMLDHKEKGGVFTNTNKESLENCVGIGNFKLSI
jgi:hypothetical protein